jgi:2-aminoadipate transaminase
MADLLRLDDGSLGDNPVLAEVFPAARAEAEKHPPSCDTDDALIEEIRRAFRLDGKAIVLTDSATDALKAIFQSYGQGAPAAVQSPAYFRLWSDLQRDGRSHEGWESVDDLCRLAKQTRVSLVYLTSNYRPMDGMSLDSDERQSISAVANQKGTLVVEDNPYDELYYEQPPKKFQTEHERTLYVGSFSKILGPHLAGFIAGREEDLGPVRERLPKPSPEAQERRAVALHALRLDYLEDLRTSFFGRWNTFKETLLENGINGFNDIEGGMFTALRLPKNINQKELIALCVQKGLQVAESGKQYSDGQNRPILRMNVLRNSPERIRQAIDILADVLLGFCRRPNSGFPLEE